MNWIRIFGSFVADSAYQNIIIGNFFDQNQTDTLIMDEENLCFGAYYYIDDVCVSTDSLFSANYSYNDIPESDVPSNFNIYPNPASDQLNIEVSNSSPSYEIEIFDVLGHKIIKQKLIEQHTRLNIENLAKGFYLIKININSSSLFYKFLKQ